MKLLGKLGIAAMAFAGLATTAPDRGVELNNPTTQSQSNSKAKQVHKTRSAKEVVKESAGGFDIVGYREGIPPYIYGTRYVRRGTHKKTNK